MHKYQQQLHMEIHHKNYTEKTDHYRTTFDFGLLLLAALFTGFFSSSSTDISTKDRHKLCKE